MLILHHYLGSEQLEWLLVGLAFVLIFALPAYNRFHPNGGDKGPAI